MISMHDTAVLMNSEDYKERFVAEYWQTKLRYDRLHNMTLKYEAGTLEFSPDCSLELLKNQEWAMGNYLRCLEVRALVEKISLNAQKESWPSFQPGGEGYRPCAMNNCTCEK